MRRLMIYFSILLCFSVCCMGCGEKGEAEQKQQEEWSKKQWFSQTTEEMINGIASLAGDEAYLDAMGATDELKEILEDFSGLKPKDTEEWVCVRIEGEDVLALIAQESDVEECSELAREYLYTRAGAGLANVFNGMFGGARVLAAASLDTYSRTYVPHGEVQNMVILIPCEEEKGICISYSNTGDGALTVSASFVIFPDEEMLTKLGLYLDVVPYGEFFSDKE